jgi:nicotinate-nucleotide adenylyltransferase
LRLLVLGGSFNPVHIGHLAMVEEIRSEFDFDLALLVPSLQAPHKDGADDPGPARRLDMLKLAIGEDPFISIDACEIERGGTSYTIDTVKDISARYRVEGKVGLVIGDDLMPGFSTWRMPSELAERADIICAHRGVAAELPFSYPHRYAHNSLLQVSSSMVRSRAAEGRPFRRLLHPEVYRYIVEHGLYGLR